MRVLFHDFNAPERWALTSTADTPAIGESVVLREIDGTLQALCKVVGVEPARNEEFKVIRLDQVGPIEYGEFPVVYGLGACLIE